MNTVLAIFKNKWTWMILLAIIVFFIARKQVPRIKRLFQTADIDLEPGETGFISSDRKDELKIISQMMYDSIYGSHSNTAYDAALNLSDTELKYTSIYYRRFLTKGVYLFTDVDDEIFSPWNDRDVSLMRRLSKIGEG